MKLHRYFAKLYFRSFLLTLFVFVALVFLIDLVEQIRRFDNDINLPTVFYMSLLHAPTELNKTLPLVILMSALAFFRRLARNSEMVVVRAAGRSAMRALLGPSVVAILIGVFSVAMFNPLVATTGTKYQQEFDRLKSGAESIFSISEEGLWLRQSDEKGQAVIHASSANPQTNTFLNVEIWRFDQDFMLTAYLKSDSATLAPGTWFLRDVSLWPYENDRVPRRIKETLATYRISTHLTLDTVKERLGNPEAISIWELPNFISQMGDSGFSTLRHEMWFQRELARPIFFLALICLAAVFAIRYSRSGNDNLLLLIAVLLAFGLFYIRNFAQVLGENGQIPVLLGAWAPPIAGLLLGIGLMLHREDG